MKWRTKDGRKISIKELTDRHLIFILLFLRKHAERELISTQIFYSTGDFDDLPDGAWMAVQSEIAEAEDAEWWDCCHKAYFKLLREAQERALYVPERCIPPWWENKAEPRRANNNELLKLFKRN